MSKQAVLAIDLGGSNGRAILGRYDNGKLSLQEIRRFENAPFALGAGHYWNIIHLYNEIVSSLADCKALGVSPASVAIDSWSQDFGLLNAEGNLLGLPHTYRDRRTQKVTELVPLLLNRDEVFEITGMRPENYSTLYQMAYMAQYEPRTLEQAATMQYIPNLLSYFMTGEFSCDYTTPSISGIMNIRAQEWSKKIARTLGIQDILPELRDSGAVIGVTTEAVCRCTGLPKTKVILTGCHDTACAITALPVGLDENVLFISSGTWSMFGYTCNKPLLDFQVMESGYSNMLINNGRNALLKGVPGMFIIQQCLREWQRAGIRVTYDSLESCQDAFDENAWFAVDEANEAVESMLSHLDGLLKKRGVRKPQSPGEYYHIVLNSMAHKYAAEIALAEKMLGREIAKIHLIGGGARAQKLNARIAELTGKKIIIGPYEATAVGNLITQLIALGELSGDEEAKRMVARSFDIVDNFGNRVM